jgi:hypothetical protein
MGYAHKSVNLLVTVAYRILSDFIVRYRDTRTGSEPRYNRVFPRQC